MLGDIVGYNAGMRRLAAAFLILAAGVTLSACGGAAKAAGTPTASTPTSAESSESTVGGYEGWWNATPANGNTAGLPQEAVAVNTGRTL